MSCSCRQSASMALLCFQQKSHHCKEIISLTKPSDTNSYKHFLDKYWVIQNSEEVCNVILAPQTGRVILYSTFWQTIPKIRHKLGKTPQMTAPQLTPKTNSRNYTYCAVLYLNRKTERPVHMEDLACLVNVNKPDSCVHLTGETLTRFLKIYIYIYNDA